MTQNNRNFGLQLTIDTHDWESWNLMRFQSQNDDSSIFFTISQDWYWANKENRDFQI